MLISLNFCFTLSILIHVDSAHLSQVSRMTIFIIVSMQKASQRHTFLIS